MSAISLPAMAIDTPFFWRTRWKKFRNTSFTGHPLYSQYRSPLILRYRSHSNWLEFYQSRLASEYGLDVIYEEDFHDIFLQEKLIPEFTSLLRKMNVVDEYDESPMSEDQFEACSRSSFFITFHPLLPWVFGLLTLHYFRCRLVQRIRSEKVCHKCYITWRLTWTIAIKFMFDVRTQQLTPINLGSSRCGGKRDFHTLWQDK